MTPKFPLGNIILSDKTLLAVSAEECDLAIKKHECGDWGELDEYTRAQNDECLARSGYGAYVLSQHRTSSGVTLSVYTSGDRFETVVFVTGELPISMLPEMFDLPWTGRPMPSTETQEV